MDSQTISSLGEYLVGFYVLIVFLIGAALLVTRKLPALITLPLMAVAIVGGTALITQLRFLYDGPAISTGDLFGPGGVLAQGTVRLANPIIVAFLGGMLSFIMQKSGVAQSLVKQGAELIGDNPLAVSCFSLAIIALLFTTVGGLGAVIMIALVVLPMLATVGVPPMVAGGILLIGISMGGIMNPQAWALYIDTLRLPLESVRAFALTLFLLLAYTGIVFICIELVRARALRQIHHAVILLVTSGAIIALMVTGIVLTADAARAALPVFDAGFRDHWLTYDAEGRLLTEFGENEVQFALYPPYEGTVPVLSAATEQGWQNFEGLRDLMPFEWKNYQSISFTAQSELPATLNVRIQARGEDVATSQVITAPLEPGKETDIELNALQLQKVIDLDAITGIDIFLTDLPNEVAEDGANVVFGNAKYKSVEKTPVWKIMLRWMFGAGLVFIVGVAAFDLLKRVRYWRKQIVEVKWYAYLIPVVPLLLIILFDIDIIPAFLVGFVYAVLVTARPGSVSMAVQSMIQGSSAVLPAVILMLGIGILLVAITGPAGWSDAHGGAKWPVITAIEPLFRQILPTGPLAYVVVFAICAPLALYRGPLNTWGLGFGVASIMILTGNLPAGAIMAMLMTVGQIQGVCDPTNTHNVWLANELRVDVNGLMLRTLPYAWGMVIVGLIIASYRYFG